MNISDLKAISEQLKAKGIDVSPASLESAQSLLIQQEIDLKPSINDVARMALIRLKNPQLSDYQAVEVFLKSKQNSLSQKQGYGDAIAVNIEEEVWQALEQSGIFTTIAQNLQARGVDTVLSHLSTGFSGSRFNNRLNALAQANQRFNSRSLQADQSIIDADFSESLDDVIVQCLPPASPKLLGSDSVQNRQQSSEESGIKKLIPANGAAN